MFKLRSYVRISVVSVVMLAMIVSVSGCLFSPDEPKKQQPIESPYDKPINPDLLMSNFKKVYLGTDHLAFIDLLHDDYKGMLQSETVSDFGLPADFFTAAEEIGIHERMFSGEPIINSDGDAQAGISEVIFDVFELEGPNWTLVEDSSSHFYGSYKAQFRVKFTFIRAASSNLAIDGAIDFYAIDVSEGNGTPNYKLIGQDDRTNN